MPESKDPLGSRKIDWTRVVLSGFAIFCLVFPCIGGNRYSWTSNKIPGLSAASAILMAIFVDQLNLIFLMIPAGQIGTTTSILKEAFVQSVHNTFFAGAMACFVASRLALLIRNPKPAEVSQPGLVAESVQRTEAAIGDGTANPA